MSYLLSIDQGTTSTRVILFDKYSQIVCFSRREHEQIIPEQGRLEHSAEEIFTKVTLCLTDIAQQMQRRHMSIEDIACCGITNQRETVVVWNRKTGIPYCNAIVWSDSRNATLLEEVRKELGEKNIDIEARTGLPISTYFSGSKLRWLVENDSEIAVALESGEAIVGTIDSYIVYKLTQYSPSGPLHVTDVTNASRTQLFDIVKCCWDPELCAVMKVPMSSLPAVQSSSSRNGFGAITTRPFQGVPITGIAGDQQAALFGHCCFQEGETKCTFGTGAFLLRNAGLNPGIIAEANKQGLLMTIAYQLDGAAGVVYAQEGSVAAAGSTLEWLKNIGVVTSTKELDRLVAESNGQSNGLVIVPAFSGLFCPHWRPDARGVILGLTLGTQREQICTAALEAIALQVNDILTVTKSDIKQLDVDGGIVNSLTFRQILADICNVQVQLREMVEITCLGAALLAGLAVGYYESLDDVKKCVREEVITVKPRDDRTYAKKVIERWGEGIKRSLNLAE